MFLRISEFDYAWNLNSFQCRNTKLCSDSLKPAAARKKHCPSTASNILISNWIQYHFWSKPHCLTRLTLHARLQPVPAQAASVLDQVHYICKPNGKHRQFWQPWVCPLAFQNSMGKMCKTKSAQTESNIFLTKLQIPEMFDQFDWGFPYFPPPLRFFSVKFITIYFLNEQVCTSKGHQSKGNVHTHISLFNGSGLQRLRHSLSQNPSAARNL